MRRRGARRSTRTTPTRRSPPRSGGRSRGLGFRGGRVLEPGCGAGIFLGLAPEGAQLTGVELDSTTAAIARALYRGSDHKSACRVPSHGLSRSPYPDSSVARDQPRFQGSMNTSSTCGWPLRARRWITQEVRRLCGRKSRGAEPSASQLMNLQALRAVSGSDTWPVPSDVAATTGEPGSITGVGTQLPEATAIPAGMQRFPSTTLTATDPVPAMKKRIGG